MESPVPLFNHGKCGAWIPPFPSAVKPQALTGATGFFSKLKQSWYNRLEWNSRFTKYLNIFVPSKYMQKLFYERYRLWSTVLTPEIVAPCEAVFVQSTAASQYAFLSSQNLGNPALGLRMNLTQGGKLLDVAIIDFGKGENVSKFQLNPNHTKLYIPQEDRDCAVAYSEGTGEMPVNFKAESNGNYTLSFSNENVEFSYLHLIDNLTGNDVDLLANPSYSFEAKTTDYASRFRLVFATGSSVTDSNFGFINGMGNLCIFGIDGTATLQVIDVTGRIISTETFSGSYEKNLNVAPGVYMLRLINGNDVKVQKMVVR